MNSNNCYCYIYGVYAIHCFDLHAGIIKTFAGVLQQKNSEKQKQKQKIKGIVCALFFIETLENYISL